MVEQLKVSEAVAKIKAAGHDISDEYTVTACIDFLNNALQQTCAILIQGRYPIMIKEALLRTGDLLPDNYMVAAGTYPLMMTDGKVTLFDDLETVRFRYFATKKNIASETEEMPFPHNAINEIILKAAIILALNENEYDISQDTALLSKLEQAVTAGMV